MRDLQIHKKYSKDFFLTLVTRAITVILSFSVSIIIVRSLGAKGQGTVTLLITTVTLLAFFLGFGFQWSNLYWAGRDKEKLGFIFANSVYYVVLLSVALVLISPLIRKIPIVFIGKDLLPFYNIMIPMIPIVMIYQFNESTLLGMDDIKKYNRLALLRASILFVMCFFLLKVLTVNLTVFLKGWLCAYLIAAFFSVILAFKNVRTYKIRCSLSFFLDSQKAGSRAWLSNILGLLLFRFDLYLIAYFFGISQVGYYLIPVFLIEGFLLIPQLLGQVLFPKISSGYDEGVNLTLLLSKIGLLYAIIIALFFGVAGRKLLMLFWGDDFVVSFMPLLFLIPGFIVRASGNAIAEYLSAKYAFPFYMQITLFVALIINITLNLLWIPSLGIKGAALSTSVAYTFYISVYLIIFCNVAKTSLFSLFSLTRLNK